MNAQQWWNYMLHASLQLVPFVALIALCAVLCRNSSARLRHGLWLLVLVKIALPPSLAAPWSIGNVAQLAPAKEKLAVLLPAPVLTSRHISLPVPDQLATDSPTPSPRWTLQQQLFAIWSAGAILYLLIVVIPYVALLRKLRTAEAVQEGALAVRLQQLAHNLAPARTAPELLVSSHVTSPFLVGLLHPRIVLPANMLEELTPSQLDEVLLHELTHWRRRDVLIGWAQVVAQAIFWFHPLVWFANSQLREERENACDEQVISGGHASARSYADSLLKVLLASRGQSSAAPGFLGIFERSSRVQQRLARILGQEDQPRNFGPGGYAFIAVLAALLLPMGATRPAAAPVATAAASAEPEPLILPAYPDAPPVITATSPAVGAMDVDLATTAITVTFDRDMGGGMSWTGGGSEFPSAPPDARAHWADKRTCVLPVQLESGKFYRVGINSTSYQNFAGENGFPVEPSAIFFTTAGASDDVKARVIKPQVVAMNPPNDARNVDPAVTDISVTFSVAMGDGFSWTGGGESFPGKPGAPARWSDDHKTCYLPVQLKPDHDYRLGLNSISHINFQSAGGVPLEPVGYRFTTKP